MCPWVVAWIAQQQNKSFTVIPVFLHAIYSANFATLAFSQKWQTNIINGIIYISSTSINSDSKHTKIKGTNII